MSFAGYRTDHPQITDALIARALGCTRTYISRLHARSRTGKGPKPSIDKAVMLERLTGGAVPCSSWVDLPATIPLLHEPAARGPDANESPGPRAPSPAPGSSAEGN